MFNYPRSKPKPIARYELRCCYCARWLVVPAQLLEKVYCTWLAVVNNMGGNANEVACPHCGKRLYLPSPGKYDRPNAKRANCGVQYVVTTK